jgi:ABC-type Mn2+/Zn2+ transport system permease subunit
MDALDPLLDPWRSGIGVRAFAQIAMLGAIGGATGFWVLTFGLAYGVESLAHGLFPGLVLGALAGLPPLAGGLGGIITAALVVNVVGRDERVGTEAATAIAVTALLGLGGALALAPGAPVRPDALLFGDPLAVTATDLAVTAVLLVTGGVVLAALHRPLASLAFDRGGASAVGLRSSAFLFALLVLVCATIAVGVQSLGNLLVLAIVVAPAAAVRRHVRSPGRAMLAAVVVAVLAGVGGVYASYHLETAAGASVAAALCLAAAVGVALPPGRSARRARASEPPAS